MGLRPIKGSINHKQGPYERCMYNVGIKAQLDQTELLVDCFIFFIKNNIMKFELLIVKSNSLD